MRDTALDAIFRPRSVAVVGASKSADGLGRRILRNLLALEFTGRLYPVNPTAHSIGGIRAYPSVAAIDDEVDLAILVVPHERVLGVVEECAEKGVRGLVVITAGFKETGAEGAARERALMEVVRRSGMRLVGPNCMGVLSTDPSIQLHATFAPLTPRPGNLAFVTQSGALGVVILSLAQRLGLGFYEFASIGNRPDVSSNDLLERWRDEPAVSLILLYLETFGNPRTFTRLAREVSRVKPVLAVKSGRTREGARAVSSHTGVLAGLPQATDAIFAQCGVIGATSVEELFDLASAFSKLGRERLPAGSRVAIVTDAGGPGILATDVAIQEGLTLGELADATQERLRAVVPGAASLTNPVDLIASAGPREYRAALEVVLDDPQVDAVLAIYVPPIIDQVMDVARAVFEAAAATAKPVAACFMGIDEMHEEIERLPGACVPLYAFPESAVRSLAAVARYAEYLRRPEGKSRPAQADESRVAHVLETARTTGWEWLRPDLAAELLTPYGLAVAPFRLAQTTDQVLAAAKITGFPLVLKLVAPRLVHKSELKAVRLDIRDVGELVAQLDELRDVARKAEIEQPWFQVQAMVRGGREVILGVVQDPSFGPLMMFGLGGIYVEAMKDVAFRVPPLTDRDADEMIASIRAFPLLTGVRGEAAVDLGAIREALLGLSELILAHPEIEELEINPFMAMPAGTPSVAVDARIRLAPAP